MSDEKLEELSLNKSFSSNGQIFERYIAFFFLFCAIVFAIATFLAINDLEKLIFNRENVRTFLAIDSVILIALVIMVVRRLIDLWFKRKRKLAGSRLQVRLVWVLSLIALTPTLLVSLGSALFIKSGVEVWFSENTSKAINQSVVIAEAYILENRKSIEADVRAVASQLQNRLTLLRSGNRKTFENALTFFSEARGLSEAIVIDGRQVILAASPLSETLTSDGPFELDILNRARAGEVVLARGSDEARVRAVMRLDIITDTYLAVGRLVDPRVIGYAERVRKAREDYEKLEAERPSIEIGLAMVLILMALLLLAMAILIGLLFSNRLVSPISQLVMATARVRTGDMSVRVEEGEKDDEFGMLGRAFNRMTTQLENQRKKLIEANQQLDTRRRFTETVLAGVSSGVIGVDKSLKITLPNKSACLLLNLEKDKFIGSPIIDILPEFKDLINLSISRNGQLTEGEVPVYRKGNFQQFFVRVSGDKHDSVDGSYVITFDDISELVSAQRRAAWSDIARRLAHEIKNPLTPIKLSAERLNKKYMVQIKDDKNTFEKCTDAIVRQVDEIGRMVDEFSNFARMPSPEFDTENIVEIISEVCFMQQQAYHSIDFHIHKNHEEIFINCDRRQVSRALTNIIQNSAEAISADKSKKGNISISIKNDKTKISLVIDDDGPGLPMALIGKLTEPYVTTRIRGTGLGLAIVKKIMEDHDGLFTIENNKEFGATAKLTFYLNKSDLSKNYTGIRKAAE
ncbi:MAG: Sensor histidine kinase YycG [Alphaproteobacteria bacterium MarineAlpha2_Bin1]|nr:MAG: Sensor histidine kinase YycG [Alphaproteobacteria bacterium MarineAlpha2_Bin1]